MILKIVLVWFRWCPDGLTMLPGRQGGARQGVPVRGGACQGSIRWGSFVRGACQATLLPVSVIEFAIVVSFH